MIFIYYLYKVDFLQQDIVSSSYCILTKQDIFFIDVSKGNLMVQQLIIDVYYFSVCFLYDLVFHRLLSILI